MIREVALFGLLVTSAAPGQAPAKKAIKFQCTCDDSVGVRYATAMRDLIAASPRYKSATEFTVGEGKGSVWNLGVRVVSIDPTVGKTGNSTVLSVVLTVGPLYMTSYVQVCTSDGVSSCAADTFAEIDQELSK